LAIFVCIYDDLFCSFHHISISGFAKQLTKIRIKC